MRAQYHRRETPGGVLIWDVRRLVRLAGALPVVELPLAEIAEFDEDWWFADPAAGLPTPRAIAAHWRLAAAADLRFPVLLCAEGRLMDGMHRAARALMDGRDCIPARRFVVTPEPDHRDVALRELPYD